MEKKIKISVIIYVLNGMPYIEKCIHSVMNQTLREIEILVVDGGSIDGTLNIVETLAKQDSRIRVIYSNPGVGRQFNIGLQEARGKYIGICESDDYILPKMYEYQYEIAERYDLDILRADAKRFFEIEDGKETILPTELSKQEELYHTVLDTTKNMQILKLGINSFWSGLYRREFLLQKKIFMNETKGAAYQDTTFYFLAIIQAKKVMLSKESFYCYRLDNPVSSVNNPLKVSMLIEEYRLLKERLISLDLFKWCKEIYLSWKINGYLGFYDSLLEDLKDNAVSLIYRDIYNEVISETFVEDKFSVKEKKVVNLVRQSMEKFQWYLNENDKTLCNVKKRLESIECDRKIIIFGSGVLGKLTYSYLLQMGRDVIAYTDNNKDLWGKQIDTVSVVEPEYIVKNYPDALYIVANERHSNIICEQLRSWGIKESCIIVCNNYIFLLNGIMERRAVKR